MNLGGPRVLVATRFFRLELFLIFFFGSSTSELGWTTGRRLRFFLILLFHFLDELTRNFALTQREIENLIEFRLDSSWPSRPTWPALRARFARKIFTSRENFGAQDWTRTSMLLALAPETSVSTNSTTWAQIKRRTSADQEITRFTTNLVSIQAPNQLLAVILRLQRPF